MSSASNRVSQKRRLSSAGTRKAISLISPLPGWLRPELGISNAVGEKEVVDGDVILVDGFLDDAHAERLRVEIDGALGIGGDGADVMNSGEGSVWSFHDGLPFCCWVVQV